MERSNLFNHLLRIFDEGLSMKTTELEYGTLEVTVENRSQDKKITFFDRMLNMITTKLNMNNDEAKSFLRESIGLAK